VDIFSLFSAGGFPDFSQKIRGEDFVTVLKKYLDKKE